MSANRNSNLFQAFQAAADLTEPSLPWQAGTQAEHKAWRRRFLPRLRKLLGHTPRRVPLEAHTAETLETDGFTRQKIYVRSEADYWIPAFVFLPHRPRAPRAPAIICLHGHSGVYPYIREGDEAERRKGCELSLDYAPRFAEQGYVTIAPIQRGWNETMHDPQRNPNPHTDCYRMAMDGFLLGRTPIGLRVWDGMRLVDYLQSRPDVDNRRIAAAGLSGGGTTCLFLSALEKRIALAMVAGYYCTFRDSIFTIFHCICNCVPGIMELGEMSDVAALIAPRPMLVISGIKDTIFPIRATRKACGVLRKTYRLLGAEKKLETDFFDGPHAWSNRKAPRFLQRHLG